MKKIITVLSGVFMLMHAYAQDVQVKQYPVAGENFFKEIPYAVLNKMLKDELLLFVTGIEVNEKIKEQWGINSAEELKALSYPAIIPVLLYRAVPGRISQLENPDMFYVPLFLNGQIKIIASVSRVNGEYHVTNFGWPLLGKQLNESSNEILSGQQFIYAEISATRNAVLAVNEDAVYNQQKLKVLQVTGTGDFTTGKLAAPLLFNDFVSSLPNEKN